MCWSAEVSMNTFLFASFVAALAYWNGTVAPLDIAFGIAFSSMQLIEYFLWRSISANDRAMNELWSKIGFVLIFFVQPILSMLRIDEAVKRNWALGLYGVFAAVSLSALYPVWRVDFSTERADNGHLRWNWLNVPLWMALIWLAFLFSYILINNTNGVLGSIASVAVYFAIPFGVSYWLYRETGTWGSMWCHFSNILFLYYLYLVFAKNWCSI